MGSRRSFLPSLSLALTMARRCLVDTCSSILSIEEPRQVRPFSVETSLLLVDGARRTVVMALMLALVVVDAQPGANAGLGLGDAGISVDVDLLVVQAAPQPFDKDIVHATAPSLRWGRLLPSGRR